MKKLLALLFALALLLSVAACAENGGRSGDDDYYEITGLRFSTIRVAFIHIGDDSDPHSSTYRHHQATLAMMDELGVVESNVLNLWNVIPGPDVEARIFEAVDWGAQMIFGTSVGYGPWFLNGARTFPNVQFFHANGYHAADAGLENFHNYVANMTQAQFLAGIAAGLRTETNRIGFVAPHPEPEVIAGFNAFFLGARSVNPSVTMDVMYLYMWNNPTLEGLFAGMLIDAGADVIAVHADSPEVVLTAQDRGVWAIGFNNDFSDIAPDAAIVSPMFNWTPFLTYAVRATVRGDVIPPDSLGGLEDGMVLLSDLNTAAAASGTSGEIASAESALRGGRNIFVGPLSDNQGNSILADGEAWVSRIALPTWTHILDGIVVTN